MDFEVVGGVAAEDKGVSAADKGVAAETGLIEANVKAAVSAARTVY